MAEGNKIRLIKIASEINIGRETIVEYLKSKGHEIDNKPTATLSEEMIEIVYDKFKREKKAAEKQREKIQKHKEIRKQAEPKSHREDEDETSSHIAEEAHHEPHKKAVFSEPLVMRDSAQEAIEAEQKAALPEAPILHEEKLAPKVETPKEDAPIPQKKDAPAVPKEIEQKLEAAPMQHEDEKSRPATQTETPHIPVEKDLPLTEKAVVPSEVPAMAHQDAAEKMPVKKAEPQVNEVKTEQPKDTRPPAENRKSVDEPVRDNRQSQPQKPQDNKQGGQQGQARGPRPQQGGEKSEIDSSFSSQRDNLQHQLDTNAQDQDARREKDSRRRRKKKKLIEVVEQGQMPKLSGLKILGKIDITKDRAPQPDRSRTFKKKFTPKLPGDAGTAQTDDSDKSLFKKKPKVKDAAPVFGEDKPKFKDKKENLKRKKKKKSIRESISQEDVDKAIRDTYAGMEFHGSNNRSKIRQKKKTEREEKETRQSEERERESHILRLTEFVTTSDLANLMSKPANEIILKCMSLGLMVTINQRLDKDTIILIADDYDFDVEFIDQQSVIILPDEVEADENLQPRSAIVTIMGHVDHGKTSLLDYIRHSNVVAGEAGGITQHIGAYKVKMPNDKSITFLDTPGHEAFTAMRARGAQVTDIVILVVAADDSVMPQTIEAISHAKAANVPIVVAINKIDKVDSNPDRIKQQLSDHGVLIEEWGGKYQNVEISAKKGLNIDLLLEKILLEADLLNLKANPDRYARGVVIESNMSKGLGSVATVIVQKGTLQIGDCFVAGVHFGKVRAMHDERGHKLDSVGPSSPVRVVGFDGLPEAGDSFFIVENEVEARNISNERKQLKREQELRQVHHVTLDEISAQIKIGGVQDLNLIIKGDVGGSVEAISDSLLKLSTEEVRVNILHKGVGPISESDIMLAAASGAVVIGFNVAPSVVARRLADNEKIDVRLYSIIYDCINEVHLALEGLLKPDIKEEITSEVEVRRIFKISRLGAIAGCYVLSGKIFRNDKVRLLRDGLPIFTGSISSLKRGKDDMREVDTSYECGIQLDGFNELQENDIIQGFKLVEVRRSL